MIFHSDRPAQATSELLQSADTVHVSPSIVRAAAERPLSRAPRLRRAAAAVIDALITLPFLVPLFWPWALVCISYYLFCESRGASIGKRLMGLRTVVVPSGVALTGTPGMPRRCNAGRSLLRNALPLAARVCFVTAWLAPIGVTIMVIEALQAAFSPLGRRLGDRLAGTQVVSAEEARNR